MSAQIVPHTTNTSATLKTGKVHEHRVEHIDNVAKAHAVDEVADAAAQDARERPLAERMAHDLHKQPREHTHAHRRQNDEQPPRAGKARPRRAVVVHAREPQQRRQQRLRLAERHRIHNEPFDGLIRRHAQNRREGQGRPPCPLHAGKSRNIKLPSARARRKSSTGSAARCCR